MAINTNKPKRDLVVKKRLRGNDLTFYSTWGLFSPKSIDEGTQLLIDKIDVGENNTILDLGCGYGALGITLAKLSPSGTVHLVDKDYIAVEFAKKNVEANGLDNCRVYLSNGFSEVPKVGFNTIVSNLPAKVGKELFYIFLNDAKRYLVPGGKLYVVTISGLKDYIKRSFKEIFGNYKKLDQSKYYTVALASK